MDLQQTADQPLDDAALLLQFESIGDNCELGLLQRLVGVEPLGLLRFAGVPLRHLLRALRSRFVDIADPPHIRLQPENGEYMVKLTKYDFTYHAHVNVGDMAPADLHRQQCRTVRFLADKLIGDLQSAAKILVFRQNEPVSAADLVDLRLALLAYGPTTLLWVQEARPGHPPGTVDVVDERLLVGYVRRLADRANVPDLDTASWLTVLRAAYRLWRQAEPRINQAGASAGKAPLCTELTFGAEGNATPCLGYGWSAPETGYTWCVGERSLISLPNPGKAETYWLEMDVLPFISPPLLPRQRLDIVIGGTGVHSFDPLPRGEVGCLVPGHLVAGQAVVEIVLDHPHAASPILVEGGSDDRRLGVAFTRIALVCA